jgi:hypothetical protein
MMIFPLANVFLQPSQSSGEEAACSRLIHLIGIRGRARTLAGFSSLFLQLRGSRPEPLPLHRQPDPVLSTDHELIPARYASLAAMQGSASGLNVVTIQRENIRPSKKEINKAVTMLKLPNVCS